MLGRSHPPGRIVGAGPKVDIDIIQVTNHIGVVAEGRHHILLRRGDILAAARDHAEEIAVTHGLERILQRRRVGGAHPVRAVTDMALGMITAVSGIGVPVDGAVCRDLERRIAVLVKIFAVLGFDRGGITAAVGKSKISEREIPERQDGDRRHHKNGSHAIFLDDGPTDCSANPETRFVNACCNAQNVLKRMS